MLAKESHIEKDEINQDVINSIFRDSGNMKLYCLLYFLIRLVFSARCSLKTVDTQ